MGFFSTVYGWISALAAGLAMLWGLTKTCGALRKWILKIPRLKKFHDDRRQRNALPQKVFDYMENIDKRMSGLEQQVRSLNGDMQTQIGQVREQIRRVQVGLQANNQATATVMLEKMMWAYHNYVLDKMPIPLDVRTALCVMFDEYRRNEMHNHIPSDFKERLMECELA